MDIKRWIILISIIVFTFAIYQAADAKVVDFVVVSFNEQTLARGFTVKSADKQLWIPVFSGQYKDSLIVSIANTDNVDSLLDKKRAVSGFYSYDIKTNKAGFLAKPVLLSLAFESENVEAKSIYFYDNHQGKWRALPTTIDFENKTARAKTIFPYAKIAVLEDDPESLTAESAIVMDKSSGNVLFTKNSHEVRSIASLTKLMTALVFLENNPGWDKEIVMQKSDYVGGATLWVKEGDRVLVKDLFYAMLVGSKNNAAEALTRVTGLPRDKFIASMNQKALDLGLSNTYFVEPTGLDEHNVSTAEEMAMIARQAFNNLEILKATTTRWYKVSPLNNELVYWVQNTSEKLLNRDLYITGSKTGWTDEAGYNLVTQAKNNDKELIALVMGAKIRMNYEEVYRLLKQYLSGENERLQITNNKSQTNYK